MTEFAQCFWGGGGVLHPPWPHSLYTYDKARNSVQKQNTMFEFRFELIASNVKVLKYISYESPLYTIMKQFLTQGIELHFMVTFYNSGSER